MESEKSHNLPPADPGKLSGLFLELETSCHKFQDKPREFWTPVQVVRKRPNFLLFLFS